MNSKILDDRLRDAMPAYATPGSAGLDLRACLAEPLTLAPQCLAAGAHRHGPLPERPWLCGDDPAAVEGRQTRQLGNLVGLIDSDYQGQLMVSALELQ